MLGQLSNSTAKYGTLVIKMASIAKMLTTYRDSACQNPDVDHIVGSLIFVNADAVATKSTTDTNVLLEVYDSLGALVTTLLTAVHDFPENVNQTIKDDINGGISPSFDTTGWALGQYELRMTISGPDVPVVTTKELFTIGQEIKINSASLSSYTEPVTGNININVGVSSAATEVVAIFGTGAGAKAFIIPETSPLTHTSTIELAKVGIGTFDVSYIAANELLGDRYADPSTLDVTISTGSYLNVLLADIKAELESVFSVNYEIYGYGMPRHAGVSMPTIIISLESRDTPRYMVGGERFNQVVVSFTIKLKDGYSEGGLEGEPLANNIYERIQSALHNKKDWSLAITGVLLSGGNHQSVPDGQLTIYEASNGIEIGVKVE